MQVREIPEIIHTPSHGILLDKSRKIKQSNGHKSISEQERERGIVCTSGRLRP